MTNSAVKSENIIELKNKTKQYDDLVVLDNLNLDIKKNEFLTLLGPSGCGKTTTLKIIAGFEHADVGEVMFEGKNINDMPPYERQVNTVFQKYALFPHMNVYENIAFGLKIKKMDNIFRVEFSSQPHIDGYDEELNQPGYMSIRFCNSGSRYAPFNILFMRMFNKLQEVDDVNDYGHQIHIEEYLYNNDKQKNIQKVKRINS